MLTAQGVVVGLDNGGTMNNATVVDPAGGFLVDRLVETPSRVREGPAVAVEALAASLDGVLALTGVDRRQVVAVGLGTPGPASARGVLSSRGSTNFVHEGWRGFDVRGALERRLGLPVVYSNDGRAAALYAHREHFGADAAHSSSVSMVVGTGLGGGVVIDGSVVPGGAGMAGEVGHVPVPLDGVLEPDQPVPVCSCGRRGDAESVASLTAIGRNLLPYWLGRHPEHELAALPVAQAARQVRGLAEREDPLALRVLGQQAAALGRLCTILSGVVDPGAFFVGGGVVEAAPWLRDRFVAQVRAAADLREEQAGAPFALVPDLDMAGARGAALAALAGRGSGMTGTGPGVVARTTI